MAERLLLDLADAQAELGGVSRMSLWRLRRDGELQEVQIGRRRFVTRQSVQDFIERQSRTRMAARCGV